MKNKVIKMDYIKDILDIIKIHPLRVKNIYQYGSRVYGNANEYSDYDFIVVASNLIEKQEYKVNPYNIHVVIPDIFIRDLKNLDMYALECIFVNDNFKIQEKIVLPDKNFGYTTEQLKYRGHGLSFNAFQKAKERIRTGDLYRGAKSIYHSFRILDFFNQIKENGKIVDFSSSNYIWYMIDEDLKLNKISWSYYKEKYLPLKIEFEEKLKYENVYSKG
jgi:predicted nucleotidyltransferase